MARTKRILISGYYGFHNIGDEAVLSAITSGLKQHAGQDVEITVLSASPNSTRSQHQVEAIPRMSIAGVTAAVRRCDLLISGGGSLIQDATSLQSLLYYLWVIALARIYRRKVMILGQGIGPLRRWISRRLAAAILNRVDLITVRDADSADLLREMGVRRPPVHLTADPTFLLEPAAKAAANEVLSRTGIAPGETVVTCALRPWREAPEVEMAATKAIGRIRDILNAKPFLLAMHITEDLEMAIRISAETSAGLQREGLQPDQLLAVIGSSDLTVAMRLHALIFAASMGIPMLGITYDPKVRSFLEAAGQEVMSLEDVVEGKLAGRIADAWDRRADLAAKLAERVPAMRAAAERNIHLALAIIGLDRVS